MIFGALWPASEGLLLRAEARKLCKVGKLVCWPVRGQSGYMQPPQNLN